MPKKKNGEICNTKLTEKNKNEIKIKNRIYFVCGRHKKVNNIDDIDISKYDIIDKIDTYDFNEKINISKKNEENVNKIIDKKENKKKPCLQHIIYLISKDDNDLCKFDDCQFAHNIDIVYIDE